MSHPMPYSSDTRRYEGTFGEFKNDGRHDPKFPRYTLGRFLKVEAPLALIALVGLLLIFGGLTVH